MRMYNCILSGKPVFTDAYKMEFIEDACAYKIHSKRITVTGDTISDAQIGGNASQEEACEQYDDAETKTELDLVIHYRYGEYNFPDKESGNLGPPSTKEFKVLFSSFLKKLEGKHQCSADEFKDGATKFFKFASKGLKQKEICMYLLEEAEDPEHCWPLCIWDDDGFGANFYFFKHALCDIKM